MANLHEVQQGYVKVKEMFSSARHVMCIYITKAGTGYQDDDENGTGYRILNEMMKHNVRDTTIYMVRDHQGEQLGMRRHEIMKELTNHIIANMRTEHFRTRKEERKPNKYRMMIQTKTAQTLLTIFYFM